MKSLSKVWRILVIMGMLIIGTTYIARPDLVPLWLIRVSGAAWILQGILDIIAIALESVVPKAISVDEEEENV